MPTTRPDPSQGAAWAEAAFGVEDNPAKAGTNPGTKLRATESN